MSPPFNEMKKKRELGGKAVIRLNKFLFQLIIVVGGLLFIPKQRLLSLFIKTNNKLVSRHKIKVPPEELLLLLPHCLHYMDCPQKISEDLEFCEGCGRCDICQLVQIKMRYQIPAFVVDGGQLALAVANGRNYRAIVAVACEEELEKGILEATPPVLGIVNQRPEGPCRNTKIKVELVERAIAFFLEGNQSPKREHKGYLSSS